MHVSPSLGVHLLAPPYAVVLYIFDSPFGLLATPVHVSPSQGYCLHFRHLLNNNSLHLSPSLGFCVPILCIRRLPVWATVPAFL